MKEKIKEKETFPSKLLKKVSSKLTAKEIGYLQEILIEQRKETSKQYEKKIKDTIKILKDVHHYFKYWNVYTKCPKSIPHKITDKIKELQNLLKDD